MTAKPGASMVLLTMIFTGVSPCTDPPSLAGPRALVVDDLTQARSAFAVLDAGGRHLIVRYQPGTLVIDDHRGHFRIVHHGGRTWFATGGEPMRRMPDWDSLFRRMSDLPAILTQQRLKASPSRPLQVLDFPWIVQLDVSDRGLQRVEARNRDEARSLVRIELPGVPDRPYRRGCTRPATTTPLTAGFHVSYLALDVPLEPDWDALDPMGLPPLPRRFCGYERRGFVPQKNCDWRKVFDNPTPAHEIATQLWFEDPPGETGQERVVDGTCDPSSRPVRRSVGVRPRLDPNPWRDLQRARDLGCAVHLIATAKLSTTGGTWSQGPGAIVATWPGVDATETIGGQKTPTGRWTHRSADDPEQTLIVTLPTDVDPAQVEVHRWTDVQRQCDAGESRQARATLGVEARYRWHCPELGEPQVPSPTRGSRRP